MWVEKFPTEFAGLSVGQARAMEATLASHALEGLLPDRVFVANLVAVRTGAIDHEEYRRRGRRWAARRRALRNGLSQV